MHGALLSWDKAAYVAFLSMSEVQQANIREGSQSRREDRLDRLLVGYEAL
jgi:hypothetical protein